MTEIHHSTLVMDFWLCVMFVTSCLCLAMPYFVDNNKYNEPEPEPGKLKLPAQDSDEGK